MNLFLHDEPPLRAEVVITNPPFEDVLGDLEQRATLASAADAA
ncbi:MAG: hypothetical protein QOE82_2156 [Thermoanaerobaculia bacterium]|jgi:hypothetical protein|nr:hypothetical protein [Thermoanaerobaculia bacterium]